MRWVSILMIVAGVVSCRVDDGADQDRQINPGDYTCSECTDSFSLHGQISLGPEVTLAGTHFHNTEDMLLGIDSVLESRPVAGLDATRYRLELKTLLQAEDFFEDFSAYIKNEKIAKALNVNWQGSFESRDLFPGTYLVRIERPLLFAVRPLEPDLEEVADFYCGFLYQDRTIELDDRSPEASLVFDNFSIHVSTTPCQ